MSEGTGKDAAAATEQPLQSLSMGRVFDITSKIDAVFDKTCGLVENHPWERWIAVANAFIERFIPLVIAIAGCAAFLISLFRAIRFEAPFGFVFVLLAILVLTFFSMYLAPRAMSLPRSMIEKREPDAVRPQLLQIFKIVFGLGVIVFLFFFTLFNLVLRPIVIAMLIAGVLLGCLNIVVFSHPSLIGIKAKDPGNVCEESIALLLLPLKVAMSLLTLIVGAATTFLTIVSVIGIVYPRVFGFAYYYGFFELIGGRLMLPVTIPVLLPLGVYLFYLVAVFILDMNRAIVCLPRKLDELRSDRGGGRD